MIGLRACLVDEKWSVDLPWRQSRRPGLDDGHPVDEPSHEHLL